MKIKLMLLVVAGLVMGMTTQGCPFAPGETIAVQFVNQTEDEIRVNLVHTADVEVAQDVLLTVGLRLDTTVGGGAAPFSLIRCDQAGSLLLRRAEFADDDDVFVDPTTNVNLRVLRLGTDYECGDRIRFVFTGDEDDEELDVTVEVVQ